MTAICRLTALAAACALAVHLTGCVQFSMAVPAATKGNTVKLYNANFDKVAVGSFTLDAGKDPGLDKSHSIRAGVLSAPGGSFAQYLGNTLKADLLAASLLAAVPQATREYELLYSDLVGKLLDDDAFRAAITK
ncbi:hypothetical protein F2P44_06660 [Massilia sp. CCM 8695]|uniref:DUF3015 domain-containing protein n=1 Tax=Massilia frigida TaxID=2609281 RepID=A0ABX0N3E9_9BURK|nr:hypothetical protein [Massilia frigida]NHZ78958.1 hypothetical protein [Massilia frigida]